jgi:signal transduction histidine kinase
MVAVLLLKFDLEESIGFVIIYPTAIFLFTALIYFAKQAQDAQARSEMLLVDLQQANKQLQAYATQVQELAAMNERNRLARELHDSVTQTIFGLTLSAQAALILLDRNPARAVAELDHLQSLAQNALAEMRALVQELHPHTGSGQSLSILLRRLVEERRSNDGLAVDLRIKGDRRLPVNVETELFRITQEALNNVVKHARANQAVVTLDLEDARQIHLKIEDAGVGFDPSRASSLPGHLGLTSMHERVQALGGTLLIDSQPGKGTCLQVELGLEQEGQHA